MTVEQIEIRKILTQMLADAGINRETLKDIVCQVIEEKADNAANTALHQINLDKKVDHMWESYIKNEIQSAAKAAISEKIKCYFTDIRVTLDFGGSQLHT